jgi:glycerate-2-kinase
MVDAKGDIHRLTKEQDDGVFTAMSGAGSALGSVTEMTFQMEDESIIKKADQYVFVAEDAVSTVEFSRWILEHIREKILPGLAISAEVITTDYEK